MLWILMLTGVLADHLTTEYGVRRHGIDIENNPLLRHIQKHFGGVAAMVFQAAIFSLLLALALWLLPEIAILLPLMIWAVVASNLIVLWRARSLSSKGD